MDYYKHKTSVEEYIQAAEGVDGSDLIDQLKLFLPQGASLIEIGTGPGTDWRILKQHFDIVGSDNSEAFLDYLNSKYPSGQFIKLDAITLETNLQFDGIYSNKVLHHLKDDELMRSIEQQLKRLNKNGVICHSFWKGEGSEQFKGMLVNYQSVQTITQFF